MDKGCFMACWAMLLRNNSSTEYLNNIYDMRVSDTILFSSVYTDPFTVMLAQWELTDTLPSSVYNSSVDRYNLTTVTASYATYTNRYSIADYYGVRSNLREYTFSSSQTEADKILIIADALEDSWSGIIVNFNSAHYLVITEDRGAQYTNLKERYIAFDPASVLDYNYLGHTWAELESSYDFDDITKIYYFAD